ncbi:MAG: DUF1152 domain-containing protein [Deltaproteobacteria bacterium]|nr:DUF1152 domain-containing protein [Deltaproteobacteria bacterium]
MQPVVQRLADATRILLAGCGGGYDVFGGVPLAVDLLDRGKQVFFASSSFCYLNGLAGASQHREAPNLYAVPGGAATVSTYCPEAWLARWLEQQLGYTEPVWAFDKTGVQPLLAAYRLLVRQHALDAVVLVDGGVDSLLRGDESSLGTPAEDLASIAAVEQLEVGTKVLACFALGAEIRDGICHAQVFERIGELTRLGGFLGASALVGTGRSGALYREAVEFAFANQEGQRRSHINKVVCAAMNGEAGSRGAHIWLSPLMNLFWFFDATVVAQSSMLVPHVRDTESIWDVSARIEGVRKDLAVRERSVIPI